VYVHSGGVLDCPVAAILLQLGTVVEEASSNRLLDAVWGVVGQQQQQGEGAVRKAGAN
jgi:hypothetical protein